ncbi:MAG: motility protein A [Epulopiscium sp.]|nr:motility protein A [Candidatus Epulonipiscium sp.]
MDISTIIGLISGVVFVVVSILLGGRLNLFFDLPSVMITIGGTFASVLISYPLNKFINSLKTIRLIFHNKEMNTGNLIQKIIDLANIARKEGLLALEEAAQSMEDKFLQKGVLLIVDGTDPELVRNILETELAFIEGRHKEVQGFWETIASLGPAWGMIGTLIGLINMLDQLNDPASIGPAMAVALITTFYGSILANFLANPTANKLKLKSNEEILLKEVMIEGLLSIQAGENPRIIEEKLKAFLSPTLRETMKEDGTEEEVRAGE